jgi:hypothetical protein
MKFRVFCDVAACSDVEVDRHFRGIASIIRAITHRPDDGGSTHL